MNNPAPTYHGKRLTPRAAIRTFCRWCNGGSPATCVNPACALFPYRMGKALPGAAGSPLRSIRARCLECAGSIEAVRACAAHKPFSEVQPEFPLWPHRDGKRPVSAEYRDKRREQAKIQLSDSGPGALFKPKQPTEAHDQGEGSPNPSTSGFKAKFDSVTGGAA